MTEELQYEQEKRWPELIAVLQKKVAAESSPAARTELLLRIAALHLEKFANHAEANKAYEQALEVDPDNRTARDSLESSYARRRQWDKLEALRERQLARVTDPTERERLRAELAKPRAGEKPSVGKQIATAGAAMISGSIILALLGVRGALLHNVLELGGIAVGVVGIIIWRGLKK